MEIDIPWVVDDDDIFHYDDSDRTSILPESDPINPSNTVESQNDNRDPRPQRQSLTPAASGVDERRPARPLPQYLLDRGNPGEGFEEDDDDDEENEEGLSYISQDEGESEVYEETIPNSESLDIITGFEEVGMRLHGGDSFGDEEGVSDDEDDEDNGEWCGRGRRGSGEDETYLTPMTGYSRQESRRSLGFRSDPRVDILRSAFVGVAQWAQGRT